MYFPLLLLKGQLAAEPGLMLGMAVVMGAVEELGYRLYFVYSWSLLDWSLRPEKE